MQTVSLHGQRQSSQGGQGRHGFQPTTGNATCTTLAPTGSISILAGCSSGIEPIFSLACKRRALDDSEFVQVHPLIEQLGRRDHWLTDTVRSALLDGTPPEDIEGMSSDLAKVLVTAHDIGADWHVRMQAAFQQHIDNAVSKTANLPASATVGDVDAVFRLAHALGCKGITIYRDGSRQGQTLSKTNATVHGPGRSNARPRPRVRVTAGRTAKFHMGCGTLFVTVNRDEAGLCEVFANLGKAGGCPSQSEATCRAVSVALRAGVDPVELIEQLQGIRCMSTCVARGNSKSIDVLSCPDAIAKAMHEIVAEQPRQHPEPPVGQTRTCPMCQQPMRKEAGCLVCDRCLHNSCG